LQPYLLEPLEGLYAFQLATEGPEHKQAPASAASVSAATPTASSAEWYCFTVSVAKQLRVTTRAVGQLFSRHLSAAEAATVLCLKRSGQSAQDAGAEFGRVLSTYAAVKREIEGAVDSLNSRKGDKLSLYPLPLVVKLMALHSPAKVSAQTLQTVREFLHKQQQQLHQRQQQVPGFPFQLLDLPLPGAGGSSGSIGAVGPKAMDLDDDHSGFASAGAGSAGSGLGLGLQQPLSGWEPKERKDESKVLLLEDEIKVKLELGLRSSRRSRRQQMLVVPVSSFLGGIPVIDLTDPATLADLSRLELSDQAEDAAADVEQTLSSLVDNFSLWHPQVEEYAVLREYGLRPDEVSVLLQEQCQRFSEYRQEIWNWHRDPGQVTPRTVGNNIRVFLLFGGFVCHSAKRHRLKTAAFDMSVFGSKHIEPYIMDFLQVTTLCNSSVWLLLTRGFMLSSTCTARAS
jgi:hypothetical protein